MVRCSFLFCITVFADRGVGFFAKVSVSRKVSVTSHDLKDITKVDSRETQKFRRFPWVGFLAEHFGLTAVVSICPVQLVLSLHGSLYFPSHSAERDGD